MLSRAGLLSKSRREFQAMLEEEICIDKHIQKILLEAKNYESKAHDICTMRIFDKDFKLNKR